MTEQAAFTIAYILDLLIGDPRRMPHPVRGMGRAIEGLERLLRTEHRTQNSELKEMLAGVLLVVIIVGVT